jgi:hypothetical protein
MAPWPLSSCKAAGEQRGRHHREASPGDVMGRVRRVLARSGWPSVGSGLESPVGGRCVRPPAGACGQAPSAAVARRGHGEAGAMGARPGRRVEAAPSHPKPCSAAARGAAGRSALSACGRPIHGVALYTDKRWTTSPQIRLKTRW